MDCKGCAERREALLAGVRSLARGEIRPALREAAVVAQSAARDAHRMMLAGAQMRLKR